MNHYGMRARDHWRTHLSSQLASIADQETFFTLLGATAESEIAVRAEALAQLQPSGEGYLAEMARLQTARQLAEMEVIREMILIDPEDREAVGQLLA